jgi:hypothetical protein
MPQAIGQLRLELKQRILLSKYAEWPTQLVTGAYNYYNQIRATPHPPKDEPEIANGITLMTLFRREATKSEARKQALLNKLHGYLLQLARTREFCRDFVNIYQILRENSFL